MNFPERWVIRESGPVVYDPDTGNRKPSPPVSTQVRGLLQQRQLTSSGSDAGNTEISDGTVVSTYVLLLSPQSPVPSSRSVLVDSSGDTYQVVGSPRPRMPASGVRRAAYIAVMVRRSSDTKEV